MSQHTVLVVGATGTIGSEVTTALIARGAHIRVLVRDATRVAHLPGNVERVTGDLRDPEALRQALTGVRSALYISPHEADEVALADGFVAACEEAGVQIVFVGVHLHDPNPLRQAMFRMLFATMLRHYQGKLRVARTIERSRTNPVILMPSNFMQNDEVFRDELLEGEFVQPLAGANRVDLRDVAEVAATVLVDDQFPSGSYSLVGPASLSGQQCAAAWERELGRPVRYLGNDKAVWKTSFARHLHGRKLVDWEASFGALSRLKVGTSAVDLATTRELLGREPRSYAEYVHDMAAAWGQLARRTPNT
jgi:uncharacterized protein YbjT (DUF2867 family)